MEPQKTFADLAEAASKQKEIANDALKEVQELEVLITQAPNNEIRQKLESMKERLVKLTRDLVANTSITSSSVASTFKIISDLAKK
jgi:hypothetical protein